MSGEYVPNEIVTTRQNLAAAIEAELKDYFFDGVSPTLGQYEVDRIVGGILIRVQPGKPASS